MRHAHLTARTLTHTNARLCAHSLAYTRPYSYAYDEVEDVYANTCAPTCTHIRAVYRTPVTQTEKFLRH